MTPPADEDRFDDLLEGIEALAHRQRLEIVFSIAELERTRGEPDAAASFTELYETLELDSSSQFAYHLDRLVGTFVAETDGGYRLTAAGERLVRAMRSGLYESATSFEDRPVGGRCVFCGTGALVATLEEELFRVSCAECETVHLTDVFPASQARGRSASAIVESFGHRLWGSAILLRGEVCPECAGPVESRVERIEHDSRTLYVQRSTCESCRFVIALPVEIRAVLHPAAQCFLYDHGTALFDVPLWEFFEHLVTGAVSCSVESLDPFTATVEICMDGETITLALDETLTTTVSSVETGRQGANCGDR